MPQFEIIRSAIIEKICEAPPEKRRKIIDRLVGEKNEEKEKTKRLDFDYEGKWSKDLIIESLKGIFSEYGKLTVPLLRKLRKENPDKYPAPTTVCYRFGSWEEVKKATGSYYIHENILGDTFEEDVGYFLSLYHQFGITTRDLYYEGRRRFPEIVPPYNRLLEIFGSFSKFKKIVELDSCSEQINRLIILIDNMNGRWPKRSICKENNIDIKFLDHKFGGRRELREFIKDLRFSIKRR